MAFAEVKLAGTALAAGDEVAAIEAIKVNVSLPSPVGGRIVTVNPALEAASDTGVIVDEYKRFRAGRPIPG